MSERALEAKADCVYKSWRLADLLAHTEIRVAGSGLLLLGLRRWRSHGCCGRRSVLELFDGPRGVHAALHAVEADEVIVLVVGNEYLAAHPTRCFHVY